MTFLILDGADMDHWQRHHSGGLLIPAGKRPTVLQADRDRAEREADAPICPWCDRQGWDTCQHADDARTCETAR